MRRNTGTGTGIGTAGTGRRGVYGAARERDRREW